MYAIRERGSASGRARNSKGFTLIELLVVIAIIGMLASIILASLNTARVKARDARRIADMKDIQTALELYYNDHQAYPDATTQTNAVTALASLTTGNYMPTIPDDPLGGTYHYVYESTSNDQYYCLGTIIEGSNPPASTCNTAKVSLTGVQYAVGP